eukprot:gene5284-8902_t
MSKVKASDVMLPIKDVIVVKEDDLTQKACGELIQKRIGSVLVKNKSGEYIGIITKSDVVDAVWVGKMHHETATYVKDIMTYGLIAVQADDDIQKVIDFMQNSNVHHVAVKDFEKTIVGLISARDVAKYLMKNEKDDQSLLFKIFGVKK